MIHVCSLARLEETVARTGARRVVSLVNAATPMRLPASIGRDNHLFLAMNDIVEATPGMTPPGETHVSTYLDWLRDWDRADPMVVHCFAGISRSTAAAYVAICALDPSRDEEELARTLRERAPSATPNRLLVDIADRLLGRDGRMTRAIAGIGRGADAFEGTPFMLDLVRVEV
jgi:predicted protein tyrosine phosphatase